MSEVATAAAVSAARMHRLIVEFNLQPDRYIDPSWLPQEWPAPYRDLARFGRRGLRVLAQHLLTENGLLGHTTFEFGSKIARLALIERSALTTLGDYCGLILHRVWLGEALYLHEHAALVAAFGRTAVPFVLHRAPPFGAIGETLEPFRHSPQQAVNMMRLRGCRLLLDLMASEGDEVSRRVRLKFTHAVSEQPPYGLNTMHRQHLAELIFMCLIPERLVQWDWLF